MLDLLSRPVGSLCDVAVMSTHIKFFVMFIPGCLSRALLCALLCSASFCAAQQAKQGYTRGWSFCNAPSVQLAPHCLLHCFAHWLSG